METLSRNPDKQNMKLHEIAPKQTDLIDFLIGCPILLCGLGSKSCSTYAFDLFFSKRKHGENGVWLDVGNTRIYEENS